MQNSKFKVYYYYHNINLWKYRTINKLQKKKWYNLKEKVTRNTQNSLYTTGTYICHYKKLNVTRLYYFKFINKQILKKYLVNYKEFNYKRILKTKIINFERRLDFNLYKTNFVVSLNEAKFLITKGFISINKHVVTSYNYLLKENDLVEINLCLYNFITKRILQNNRNNNYCHLRNLQIDYKTLSFVFLDNKNFFITNYNNFIKKIYFKYDNNSYSQFSTNKIIINNFYKFFDVIFENYLFINNNSKYLNSYKTNILFKFLKYKYNIYYFRNILLKKTFNIRYNYLKILINNNFVYSNIQNLIFNFEYLFNTDLKVIKYKNNLNKNFFNYYYILFFNFYIYSLKYFNIIKNHQSLLDSNFFFLSYFYIITNFSINTYNYLLLFYFKIFRFLNIKNKLTNYYNIYIDYNNNNNLNLLKKNDSFYRKKIDYKLISQNLNSRLNYNSNKIYNNIITYISCYKFNYKIFKHYKDNYYYQNNIKKIKIINKIKKSFSFTKFNCSRYGIYTKKLTKKVLYNNLKSNKILKLQETNNVFIQFYNENSNFNKYNNNINLNFVDNKNSLISLKKSIKQINYIYSKIKSLQISNEFLDYLNKIEKQLYFKIKIINDNSLNIINNNNIYYYFNLINSFKNEEFIDYKNKLLLSKINLKIYYKMHFLEILNYNQNLTKIKKQNKKYYLKVYKRFVNDFRRFQLNSVYNNFTKTRLSNISNLKSYFLKNNINYNNSSIQKSFFYFYNYFFDYKSKDNLYNIYLKKHKNLLLKVDYNIKNNKKLLLNIFKSKYLIKRNNINSFDFMVQKKINLNSITNSKIIQNNNFNDSLFYIDLILNLSIRKFNIDYNKFYYRNYKIGTNKINRNNFIILRKNSNNNNLLKKNNKITDKIKFYYKNYAINNFTMKFNMNFIKNQKYKIIKKKLLFSKKLNKLYFYINYNFNNNLINYQLFKNYYNLYHSNFKGKKIFIKINKFNYINTIYKIYNYYKLNLKKYNILKYLYTNYIFKEYNNLLNKLLINSSYNNLDYIKQLYFNLIFSKILDNKSFDYLLNNNFKYSKNLQIIINYFIIINRLYK